MEGWLYFDLRQEEPVTLVETMMPLGLSGFGFGPEKVGFVRGYLEATLARSQHVLLAEGVGFFIFSQPEALHENKIFLWIDAVVLSPGFQGQGLSLKAVNHMLAMLGREKVGWVAGRSQSPHAMRALAKLGPVRPFDKGFDNDEGRLLVNFIKKHIVQANQLKNFQIQTGIQVGAYGQSLLPAGLKVSAKPSDLDHHRGDVYICVCQLQ